MKDMFYYIVMAKCGHVGRGKYCVKPIPLKASSKKDAAKKARNVPRVKHDWKDAIESVTEITEEEFNMAMAEHHNDPFFTSKNIQEQRASCNDIEILEGETPKYLVHNKKARKERVEYKLKKREQKNKSNYYDFIEENYYEFKF